MPKKKTIESFIEKCKIIHGDKYDYSKFIYTKSCNKGIIICKEHGEFYQTANVHLSGANCLKCSMKNKPQTFLKSKDQFIKEANIIHNNRYDYSKFIYLGTHKKGIIICKEHGEFLQSAIKHLNKNNCSKCSKNYSYSTTEFIDKCMLVHGNKYDYSKFIYLGTHRKGLIICKEHGEFHQTPNKHLIGHGCNNCRGKISKVETEFLDYLNIPNTLNSRQLKIHKYKVDGYDTKTNTIYEFLGDYWHGNLDIYKSENINTVCNKSFQSLNDATFKRFYNLKLLGYNIKYIWESNWLLFRNNASVLIIHDY